LRYYRRKNKEKIKAVFLKILFVLVSACIVTTLAIITGKLLQVKVQSASEHLETSVPPSGNSVGRETESSLEGDSYSSLYVYASGLSLPLHETEDSLVSRIHTISGTYDTVSVEITKDNRLLYVSPSLSELLRMPLQDTDPMYTRLKNLCTAAKARDLRLSAVFSSSLHTMDNATAALSDSTIAAELYALGFDEILFVDILPETVDTDTLNIAKKYLQTIRDSLNRTVGDSTQLHDFSVGACLPYNVYMDAVNAKQIQMIATTVDFLAIDLSSLPVRSQTDMTLETVCQSLAGSFSVYNLRALLGTKDLSLLAAQSNVLAKLEITNLQYLDEITPTLLTEATVAEPEETETETTEETPSSITNPYATTLPSDGVGNTGSETTEPEETYYRTGEDSWW